MRQSLLPLDFARLPLPGENRGAVYTKPWVVELLVDLAEYRPEANLVDALAIEPAAGAGAFLSAMVRRLMTSCRRQGRPPSDCRKSIIAYEIDQRSVDAARLAVVETLDSLRVEPRTAQGLAESWVRLGDYLLDAPQLPLADFVIGNPPYVRLEDIPAETASLYRGAYSVMIGRADLYVAFFEAALGQLNGRGVCAFICADRWMLNQYGAELRRLVTSRYRVESIIEMHNADAFDEEVSAYPAITVIRRGPQGKVVVASAGAPSGPVDSRELAESLRPDNAEVRSKPVPPIVCTAVVDGWFRDAAPWPCGSPDRLALLRRLEERFPALEDGDRTRVGIGVATGRDDVFITKDQDLVESDRLLPLAMAADTATGRLRWSGHYLVDPWSTQGLVNLRDYPRLKTYLESHKDVLSRRHTARKNADGWYRTIDRVTHSLTSRPKLYVPDIKDVFNPVLDESKTYPHHNLYYIVSDSWDLAVLGGILLSSVAQLFIESYGVRMRGGYLRFQAQYLRRVRVPDPRSVTPRQARELAEAFQARDRERATVAAREVYAIEPGELGPSRGH